jgi:predicted nucleotidyltransferase component of viral defense system
MAFKGGTSLSKVFNAIYRFSEDVDVTLDYRNWGKDFDPFSTNSKTQQKRRSDELKARVGQYVQEVVKPHFEIMLNQSIGDDGSIEVNGGDGEELYVHYPSVLDDRLDYITDKVFVEFGGRNITEPKETHTIKPYLSEITEDLEFPSADVDVLSPRRTFWEKATLIHVECNRDREATPERISRHWYDVAMLLKDNIGKEALADIALLQDVVHFKKMFFPASYANYDACLEGGFRLVPEESSLRSLEEDYRKMISSGMFDKEPPSFEEIVQTLRVAQEIVNGN